MNNQKPAFPIPDFDEEGMTLRDYFAAKAMQMYIMSDLQRGRDEINKYGEATYCWSDAGVANNAYDMADAMMKAREE